MTGKMLSELVTELQTVLRMGGDAPVGFHYHTPGTDTYYGFRRDCAVGYRQVKGEQVLCLGVGPVLSQVDGSTERLE